MEVLADGCMAVPVVRRDAHKMVSRFRPLRLRRSDPALRAADLSQTDSAQFCRWNLVSAVRAERSE